jgi:chromatin remodeling complex protein RSC6
MFPDKRERSWNLQERRAYSLDIVNHQKLIESMFQVNRRLKSSRDVTFDERIAFKKSIEDSIDSNEEEEHEDPKEESTCSPEHPSEEQEPPHELWNQLIVPKTRKRPTWLESTLQEAEKHKAPSGTFRQSKKPKRFSSYAALMTSLVNAEPSTFEEAVKKKEWKEAMMEEYQSIMKNDVWEIVPRPEGKSVVTSKWVYKIKHAV